MDFVARKSSLCRIAQKYFYQTVPLGYFAILIRLITLNRACFEKFFVNFAIIQKISLVFFSEWVYNNMEYAITANFDLGGSL